MVKYFFFLVCIFAFCDQFASVSIECDYSTFTFEVLGVTYRCLVKNNPNIMSEESAQITSTYGTHQSGKSNNEVAGFHAHRKTIQYFPKGLEKNFKNIKLINLNDCKLKEVHQSDLKPFPNLIFLYIFGNMIEIIEPGLFDYNLNLEYISIGNNKIVHIDPNVFDGLTKLWHLHLNSVPCYNKFVCTLEKTQNLIGELKTKCKDSEFLTIEEKMKNLEIEEKSLGYNDFNTKVVGLEEDLRNSKFSSDSFLKNKLEILKFIKVTNTTVDQVIFQPMPQKTPVDPKVCTNCCLIDQILAISMNLSDVCSTFEPFKNNIENKLSGIKSSINSHDSKLSDLQTSQNSLKSSISTLIPSINDLNTKITDLKTSQTTLSSFQNDTLHNLKTSQETIKSSQEGLKSSQNQFKSSQDEVLGSLTDIKTTISDIESSLSNVKTSQNEVKSSLSKLRISQNEIGVALEKISKSEESGEKCSNIEGKLENLEGHLMEFEAKTGEKFEEIKQDLANTRHKISVNFDEKIKGIEKRLMKKFEDLLGEKLGKILDEKMRNLIEARLGNV